MLAAIFSFFAKATIRALERGESVMEEDASTLYALEEVVV